MMSPFGSVSSTQMNLRYGDEYASQRQLDEHRVLEQRAGRNHLGPVTATFTPITPIISQLFGTKALAGSASMTIN